MIAKDTSNNKMPEEAPAEAEGFNLDGILSELGSFGKYHVLLLLLLAFRDTFLTMCNYHYVFTASDVAHRCVVAECEAADGRFNASWSSFVFPNSTPVCYQAAFVGNSSVLLGDHDRTPTHPNATSVCSALNYSPRESVACEGLVYEDYNSIVAEFDLGCTPWKRTLVGSVHNVGLIFSSVLSGIISDRYGRKVVIVCSPLVVGVLGLIKSFSVNYWMLIALEFLEAGFGYGTASMVLSLESVSQKRRVIFSCMWDILVNFGSTTFSLIAWQIPYWRSLMRAIYAPLLVAVFYMFLVDEGVRWLLAHDKGDEAVRVLNKVAKYNNVTLSAKAKEMLLSISQQHEKSKLDEEVKEKKAPQPLLSALRSRRVFCRLCLVAAQLFCCSFVYNGVIINVTSISGDPYLNMAALNLVQVPTRILTALTLNRFGRKAPVCCAYFLCSIFFVTSALVPKSMGWSSLLFYLAGQVASSYGMFAVFIAAMEAFPTTSRNILFNVAQLFGRPGSAIAPQSPLLAQYYAGLPSLIFGLVALGPALLSLLMPDTSKSALPTDVSEAERLDDAPPTPDPPHAPPAPLAHHVPAAAEQAQTQTQHTEVSVTDPASLTNEIERF